MDVDTSEAIDRIGARIDALETSLRDESSSLRAELRAQSSSLRAELRAESSSLRADYSSLRTELRDGLARNRRHTEVLFESLRDDIRMLADGFAIVSTKLDSLQR